MSFPIHLTQICYQMKPKSHCTKAHKVAQYVQQHPTRLGKQLLLKLSGYLFLQPLKYNNTGIA